MNRDFWQGKRVLITGHTGFKGGWLSLWLQYLGADVIGVSLPPAASPNLFSVAHVGDGMKSIFADIRDIAALSRAFEQHKPEIVFHLAAQSLVRASYVNPVETYATNVMGTVNVLEAIRMNANVRVCVNVTSDKCYENREWPWGYREIDRIGGRDPYSNSKGCAELVTAAYRASFFDPEKTAIASVRAGNVIAGGDWAEDRLVPDLIRAIQKDELLVVRNPDAVRPWQHVLEPLSGYLLLAERLWDNGPQFAQAWNFGPSADDVRPVRWIVEKFIELWSEPVKWRIDDGSHPHEARFLGLDSSMARTALGWRPRWTLEDTLASIVDWCKAYRDGKVMAAVVKGQIETYANAA